MRLWWGAGVITRIDFEYVPDPAYVGHPFWCGNAALPTRTGHGAHWRCGGGLCIEARGFCNGFRNCVDGSDEQACEASVVGYQDPRELVPAAGDHRLWSAWTPPVLILQEGPMMVHPRLPSQVTFNPTPNKHFREVHLAHELPHRPDVWAGRGAGQPFGWTCDGAGLNLPAQFNGSAIFDQQYCDGELAWETVVPPGLYYVRFLLVVTSLGRCFLNDRMIMDPTAAGHLGFDMILAAPAGLLALRAEGPGACGMLVHFSAAPLDVSSGNRLCWDGPRMFHTCCQMGRPPNHLCWGDGTLSPEVCCLTAAPFAAKTLQPYVVTYPALGFTGPGPLPAGLQCLGPGPAEIAAVPEWIVKTPYPSPLRCADGLVTIPVGLPVPLEAVVPCVPPKYADIATLRPWDRTTFMLLGWDQVAGSLAMEQEYFRMYEEAMFAITTTKSGQDAFRHGEIMAMGAVPLFLDFNSTSRLGMGHMNRGLMMQALVLPGVLPLAYVDSTRFDARRYVSLAARTLQWTRHRMTTHAVAAYALKEMGINVTSRTRVLAVSLACTDVFCPLLLHGLRSVVGGERVLDYPELEGAYRRPGRPLRTPADPAPHFMLAGQRLLHPIIGDRSEAALIADIAHRRFHLVIFLRASAVFSHADNPVVAEALRVMPKSRLAGADDFDHIPLYLQDMHAKVGYVLKVNSLDCCPEDGVADEAGYYRCRV
mmetsp:Transcript_6894/g.16953  ORF Transcript_6894/g.16953 Transcript_6894/m.16953 type:complete len:705 (-) Transcript_6894:123-2237(-)